MTKNVVTLYIDDGNLRLLVAKGKRVKKWATLPLESRLVRDGVIFHEAKLAAKIKELLKSQRVRTRKVIAGLSGLHCLCRVITLPHLPESMLAEAIRREAERALSVPLDQVYLSWQIISTSAEEIKVFLAALPRNATDALIETLHQAGIRPYLIDSAPLALARVTNRTTAIIIDTRSTELDIVVMIEGVPQLIRSLPLPSKAQSMQGKLPTIREELERTIKFYNSGQPVKPLEPGLPILASGELADESEVCQSLSDELGHPVLPLASPLKCPKDFAPSQYMVNIGLALKELSPEKGASLSVVNLNALPEVYQPKAPQFIRPLITVILTIMAIGSLVPLVMLVRSATADTASLQAQLDTTNQFLEQRYTQQQSQREEITGLEDKVAELEVINSALTTVRNDLRRQQYIVNGDLEAATSNLPATSDLNRITHASVELTVSGMAPDETEVLTYANALRASGRFSQVIVSSIETGEDEVSFTLTLIAREYD